MGKNKNRARQRDARARKHATGERYTTAWRSVDPNAGSSAPAFTPVQHLCGCVIDWGWNVQLVPPPLFIHWFMQLVDFPCPWHGGLSSPMPRGPEGDILCVTQTGTQATFYARRAQGEDLALGRDLSGQLREVVAQVLRTPPDEVPLEVPEHYRTWLIENDPDPMNAWLDQRLADIVLNRGNDTIARVNQLLAHKQESAESGSP